MKQAHHERPLACPVGTESCPVRSTGQGFGLEKRAQLGGAPLLTRRTHAREDVLRNKGTGGLELALRGPSAEPRDEPVVLGCVGSGWRVEKGGGSGPRSGKVDRLVAGGRWLVSGCWWPAETLEGLRWETVGGLAGNRSTK